MPFARLLFLHSPPCSHLTIHSCLFAPVTVSPFPPQGWQCFSAWWMSFFQVRAALGVLVLRGLVTTSSSARRPHVVDYTIQVRPGCKKEISASVWPKSIFSFSLRKWLDFSACLLCSHQFEQSMGKELRQFCFKQSGLKPETWVNRPTQIQRAQNILIRICRDSNHNSN